MDYSQTANSKVMSKQSLKMRKFADSKVNLGALYDQYRVNNSSTVATTKFPNL